MMTAKIFKNGRSQAVRLPKEYRFDCDEVYVNKVGDMVMLIPKGENRWKDMFDSLDFSEDYMEEEYQRLLRGEPRD